MRLRWVVRLALLVALLLSLPAINLSTAHGVETGTEVRITAQRVADGRTEFALQQRGEDGGWGARILPARRFFPANVAHGRWLVSAPLTIQAQADSMSAATPDPLSEVRITARRLGDGRTEFGLQQRGSDGQWGERLLPQRRFFPANVATGRWLVSSPLTIQVEGSGTAATACAFSEHVDRVAAATFQVRTAESSGTAFYIGDGEWITNHHVVGDNSLVLLRHGEDQMWAQVIGTLPSYDLAMLEAQPSEAISPLVFAPNRPALASAVTVVGFPAYVQDTPSVVRGIVSKHVPLSQFEGMASDGMALQTDAPANPGNSGGPIVDDCGMVVAVTFSRYEYTAGGRPIQGIGFGIAAETAVAQIPSLRANRSNAGTTPDEINNLTISAFCSRTLDETPTFDECEDRSLAFDTSWGSWALYAVGVVEFDDVVYRFDGEGYLLQEEVMPALLTLAVGCHELEIAENGVSTHWSLPYEFCFVDSTLPADSAIPATPTGLWVAKIDVAFAPDDIRVTWNAVPGATWYELYHAAGDGEWVFKATVTNTTYVDTFPSLLFADHYTVRACNASGCSEFSAVATLN